jgi:hypothetical protein
MVFHQDFYTIIENPKFEVVCLLVFLPFKVFIFTPSFLICSYEWQYCKFIDPKSFHIFLLIHNLHHPNYLNPNHLSIVKNQFSYILVVLLALEQYFDLISFVYRLKMAIFSRLII